MAEMTRRGMLNAVLAAPFAKPNANNSGMMASIIPLANATWNEKLTYLSRIAQQMGLDMSRNALFTGTVNDASGQEWALNEPEKAILLSERPSTFEQY